MGGEDARGLPRGRYLAGTVRMGLPRTRTRTIAGGTSEIHRDKIAERMLGLPRDNPFKDVAVA